MKIVSLYKFNEKELDKTIAKGFEEIGLDKALKSARSVFIKPNLVTDVPEYIKNGANTDIRIVEGVLKYLSKYDLKISIGESDTGSKVKGRKLEYALKLMGIDALKKRYKFDIVNLTKDKQIEVNIPNAEFLKKIKLAKIVINSDIIIDLPKIKTHKYSKITCALKNMFGTIPDPLRIIYHENIHQTLADLNRIYLNKTYVLTDGIVGMEGDGPIYGNPIKLNVLLFSNSMYCNDLTATKIMGLKSGDIKYLELVGSYLSNENKKYKLINHIQLKKIKKNFKLPKKRIFSKLEGKAMQYKPFVKIIFNVWFQKNISYRLRHVLKKLRGGSYSWYIKK